MVWAFDLWGWLFSDFICPSGNCYCQPHAHRPRRDELRDDDQPHHQPHHMPPAEAGFGFFFTDDYVDLFHLCCFGLWFLRGLVMRYLEMLYRKIVSKWWPKWADNPNTSSGPHVLLSVPNYEERVASPVLVPALSSLEQALAVSSKRLDESSELHTLPAVAKYLSSVREFHQVSCGLVVKWDDRSTLTTPSSATTAGGAGRAGEGGWGWWLGGRCGQVARWAGWVA